jgi:ATP-binding cassette, subfamily C (CFTR/MRP), member 1
LVTLALYTIVQNITGETSFSAAQAFTTLSLVNLISAPVAVLVQSFPGFASGLASLARVQNYVISTHSRGDETPAKCPPWSSQGTTADEKSMRSTIPSRRPLTPTRGSRDEETCVVVRKGTFGWREDAPILKNIDFRATRGSLNLITGPVAAGKSTLLWGILGELPASGGDVWMERSQISFCPQTPWLVSGSVRHNIICGMKYEKEWYDQVIAACALTQDLKSLDNGDHHEVGNEGRNLSGGQLQRVVRVMAPILLLTKFDQKTLTSLCPFRRWQEPSILVVP